MNWNLYLYNKIKNMIMLRPKQEFFKVANSDGSTLVLDNYKIYNNMLKYTELLSNYTNKICAIYHNFDEKFVGFVIAAIKCHVKVLVRRTSLNKKKELINDINFLKSILPVNIVFSDVFFKSSEHKMVTGYPDIYYIDDSYNTSDIEFEKKEYDFIQLSSGTTDSSKAFCLSIEGLIKSAEHICHVHHVHKESIILSYLTLSHIYGFVSGFLVPIISESTGLFCKTSYIKDDPTLLFKLILSEKVTHTAVITNTLIKALETGENNWDLSSLVCVSLGGEKIDYYIYNKLLLSMIKIGMRSNALVNSYGMSEKGSITMEDPYKGNYLYYIGDKVYVSVGNAKYLDTDIVIVDDNGNLVEDGENGMIGVASPYIARYYCNKRIFCKLRKIKIHENEYYQNGDCGFIFDGKLFVTGRIVNTLTYNGLKLESEILNEFISKYLIDNGISIRKCFCFNYPEINNYIVCFIDYDYTISEDLCFKITEVILNKYHIKISDYFVDKYEGDGIQKISLPNIIIRYKEYRNKYNKQLKKIH